MLGEWEGSDDPEESPTMAGVVAGVGARLHWMSLETQRGSSETERDLERAVKKPMITTSGER
jgi:hypothetical protein